MKSYQSTLSYLYGLQYRGMKFGLRNIRALLAEAGNPERCFPAIHIAGTNGKGSTASFMASAFKEAGYRTGLYTSPHLVSFTERIRINGVELQESALARYVAVLRPAIERTTATFFEATTCVAFLYFADEGVDIAVIETGLGGRLDATNVLRPLVSVITNIGLDHTDLLGRTTRAVAREKGGIIKDSIPVVTGTEDPDALKVLRRISRLRRAPLVNARDAVRMQRSGGGRIRLAYRGIRLEPFVPGLTGEHQMWNAALALAALGVLKQKVSFRRAFAALDRKAIRRGFVNVVRNTGLHGRFELADRRRKILLDVAHNPDGMRTLAHEIERRHFRNLVAVFGVMKDKDYGPMLDALARIARPLIAVAPRERRALSARQLTRYGQTRGYAVVFGGSVREGIRKAVRLRGKGSVLVTGSHYVVGEAMRALRGKTA